jgi:nicotinate-nucleotide adenylyltransferase
LMVTGRAPHKEIEDDPGGEVRLEMARLAAGGEDGVEASDLEVGREEVSYSYRTLELLTEEDPERELYFLMGADMAAGLGNWKEPERVVELSRLGVVQRPGVSAGEVNSVLERLGASDRAEIIDMPLCGASSTTVRERVREGRPLRHLVPDAVIGLIGERGLYR